MFYRLWTIILAGMLMLFLCSCKSAGVTKTFQSEGEQKLTAGIRIYEEGNYSHASRLLQEALTKGLPDKSDRIQAHKYLAFIHCISGRTSRCAGEFHKILDMDPKFELKAAEAGHPVWGPVFRSEKAKRPR